MVDLLNYNLLDDYFKQFSPIENGNSVFDKFEKRTNKVESGFTYSNGLTEILAQANKKLNP
mgnify:CR=1 FL=1